MAICRSSRMVFWRILCCLPTSQQAYHIMHQGYNRYNKGEKNEVLVAFLKKSSAKNF
jgi:hypothetical protein